MDALTLTVQSIKNIISKHCPWSFLATGNMLIWKYFSRFLVSIFRLLPKSVMISTLIFTAITYLTTRITTSHKMEFFKRKMKQYACRLLQRSAHIYAKRSTVRQMFRDVPMGKARIHDNVLHPEQRAHRKTAINFIDHLAVATGLTVFNMQPRPSQTDQPYNMTHHWLTDIHVPLSDATPGSNSMVSRIDSDYYENIELGLLDDKHFNINIIYHHSPTRSAASKSPGLPSFTFDENSNLIVHDNGAVRYSNPLWDYNTESIEAYTGLMFRFWKMRYRSYQVETRRVSTTHAITALIPRVEYKGIWALLARVMYGYSPLQHVNNKQGDFTVQRLITENSDTVSIARTNNYNEVTISNETLESLSWLHENAKMPITIPKIKTKAQLDDARAAILQNYIVSNTKRDSSKHYVNYKVVYGTKTYQMYPDTSELNPVPSMTPFMYPVVDGAFNPARGLSSEIASVEGRLTKLHKDFRINPTHYYYFGEFLERLIPDPHLSHPKEVDDVFEKQNRPSQQAVLFDAIGMSDTTPFQQTFVKKEAYGKIADPRIITTEKSIHKLKWSQYQYTVAEFLKQCPWYSFGKTPATLAHRLAKIAQQSQFINCTDFSRMDGRKTVITRTLERLFMLRLFHSEHHADIIKQFATKQLSRACTATYDDESFHYNSLYAQGSGLPDTSNFNSLDNAYINFIGYYKQHGDFDIAYECLINLTMIAGDDTCAGNLDDKSIRNSAQYNGHLLTSNMFKRGESGVNFLARIYGPYLWEGDPNSCTDIIRALAKLHTTVNLPVNLTPFEKLGQKLTSLWYTDQNTPIISTLIDAYLHCGGQLSSRRDHVLATYWSKYDKCDQYPNSVDEWMWDLFPADASFIDLAYHIRKKILEVDNPDPEVMLRLPLIYAVELKPHSQQVVIENNGTQELLGADQTRVDQPTRQVVHDLIPPLPTEKIATRILAKYNFGPKAQNPTSVLTRRVWGQKKKRWLVMYKGRGKARTRMTVELDVLRVLNIVSTHCGIRYQDGVFTHDTLTNTPAKL